jgi:hypothetical protein
MLRSQVDLYKLIYRMCKDVFTPPLGSEQDPCVMQLIPVHKYNTLGKDGLQPSICSEVHDLLEA